MKYSDQEQGHFVVNEVLVLYRYIVEKYVNHSEGKQTIFQLILFLDQFWDKFHLRMKEKGEEREQTIILSGIMRIMTLVLCRTSFSDMD